MTNKSISLLGAPVQSGTSRKGCKMGPDAYRTARLGETLEELGHSVVDLGNLDQPSPVERHHDNSAILELDQTVAPVWASMRATTRRSAMIRSPFGANLAPS